MGTGVPTVIFDNSDALNPLSGSGRLRKKFSCDAKTIRSAAILVRIY